MAMNEYRRLRKKMKKLAKAGKMKVQQVAVSKETDILGRNEVIKMSHYFHSVEATMAPFSNFRTCRKGESPYWYLSQGGKVLLVAHADTVQTPTLPRYYNGAIYASGLDDRLGVYLCMRLFEKRTDVDVLITTDEEKGRSTAGNVPDALFAGYNSIVELDRAGNDFVHYDLADDKLENAYKEFAPLSFGSFSDICFIDEDALKCGCINVGIGYQLSHSTNSYVEVDSLTKAWKGINSFLNKYSSIKFDKPVKKYSKYGPSKYDYWGSYEYDYSGFPKGKETSSSVSIVEKCLGCGIELLKSEEEEGMCCLCQDIDYRYKASFRHF